MKKKIIGISLVITSIISLTGCSLLKDPKSIVKTDLIEIEKKKDEAYIIKKESLKFKQLFRGVVKSKNIIGITSTMPDLVFDKKLFNELSYVKKGDIIAQGYTNIVDNKIQTQHIQIQECESKLKMLQNNKANEYEVKKVELELEKQRLILKQLYEDKEQYIFKSPIDGQIVSIISAKKGDVIEKNKVIASITDIESKVIFAVIEPKSINNYYIGMKVEIEYMNKIYEGTVKEINLSDIKELRIEKGISVEFNDKVPEQIKLNELVNCVASGEEKKNIVAIPVEYLKVDEFKNSYVNVLKDDVIEKRIIETGITDGKLIEVKSGLEFDEGIVLN